ncbi:MAG: 1,4-alpha-glucan branching enzyme, partial [Hoeflea sp.]
MNSKGTARDADQAGIALPADQAEAIASGAHGDPFAVLGLHETGDGFFARTFVPGAETIAALTLDGAAIGELGQGAV